MKGLAHGSLAARSASVCSQSRATLGTFTGGVHRSTMLLQGARQWQVLPVAWWPYRWHLSAGNRAPHWGHSWVVRVNLGYSCTGSVSGVGGGSCTWLGNHMVSFCLQPIMRNTGDICGWCISVWSALVGSTSVAGFAHGLVAAWLASICSQLCATLGMFSGGVCWSGVL